MLLANSILCSGNCRQEKTINHRFLECDFISRIWHLGHRWLGISTIVSSDIGFHTQQFFGVHAFKKEVHFFFPGIWLVRLWVIWKESNLRIFNNKGLSHNQLLDSIKILYFFCGWMRISHVLLLIFIFDDICRLYV